MNTFDSKWQSSDAWILLALFFARKEGTCRLADVIHCADAINKAIPSLDEMHGALNRLLSADLIVRRQMEFDISPKGRELLDRAFDSCGDCYEQWDELKRLLHSVSLQVDRPPIVEITELAYLTAYADHCRRFRQKPPADIRKRIAQLQQREATGD